MYAVLQRQVRHSLHDQLLSLPGNKGWTPTPTAAVRRALFPPVMLGQTTVQHSYGVQPHHLLIYDALGLDHAWYAVPSDQENSP